MFKFKKIKPFTKLNPKQKFLRILKLIGGIIIFITLPTLLLFGFMYFKYNEPLPEGIEGEKADALAHKMLNALNYPAYNKTDYIEFTFKGIHHYKWQKRKNMCEVFWKDFKVNLNLDVPNNSEVFISNQKYEGVEKQNIIQKATDYFNNDSFWLVAPYKIFDKGVKRKIVVNEENKKTLLVTYTSGGTTPGDSYLWHLDKSGVPTSFQMWVSILPIDGLEATWSNWMTSATGAKLPTSHELLFLDLKMTNILTK